MTSPGHALLIQNKGEDDRSTTDDHDSHKSFRVQMHGCETFTSNVSPKTFGL